jgi:serine/threonine protein kinase
MTMTGALVGSAHHMAPEIVEGRDADARSDLFSLGTLLSAYIKLFTAYLQMILIRAKFGAITKEALMYISRISILMHRLSAKQSMPAGRRC